MDESNKFFKPDDEHIILESIKEAELRTSGEIRVHIEENAGGDPLQTARKAFESLGMRDTELHNGVLFFLAVGDRKFVILGDDGINNKVPNDFWERVKMVVQEKFKQGLFAQGLAEGAKLAGEQLAEFFPCQKEDTNELPNSISYRQDKTESNGEGVKS